ncbi:MAG: hypothetical protein JXB20_01105 [Bacilli bacterium]|nr:hypothetical protein [Bacilli bacterium]
MKLLRFFTKDIVFVVAFLLALGSLFFVKPSLEHLEAINYEVLIIMFSLMISVAGISEANFFSKVAIFLTSKFFTLRWIGLVIVLSTFLLGMWITNDAVLLTLVPFTIYVMRQIKEERYALTIVIMQTFAANMGSALTPMGDPQNIYLYHFYDLGFGEFIMATLPITLSALILIIGATWLMLPNTFVHPIMVSPRLDKKKLLLELLVFTSVLLLILRVVYPLYVLGFAFVINLLIYPHLFRKVDYLLLLTFVSFFVLTYNLANWNLIQDFASGFLDSNLSVYLAGLGFSQVMSNVPAAVLLATFTDKTYWVYLLQGVNVGAMGSVIGSLASLITFKFVIREFSSEKKTYLLTYTALSFIFIVIISAVLFIIFH